MNEDQLRGRDIDDDLTASERRILESLHALHRKVDKLMSSVDPLEGEIGTLSTDVGSLRNQNNNLIALVQKLAAANNVNTAADLAALLAVDSSITTITAADVAAIAAQPPNTAAAFTIAPTSLALAGASQTGTAEITDPVTTYSGGYTATSSDDTVATAVVTGTTVTVTEVGPGSATISLATAQTPPRVTTLAVTGA